MVEKRMEEEKERYHRPEVQASVSPRRRRASRTDLSIMTPEELARCKKARSRKSSALARKRQADREQELREQVETLSLFQVLVEAAPDAILLVFSDMQACILFANDRCGRIMRLNPNRASEDTKEQELVGRCLWE
jgi:PAS domain-containing protein